VSRYQRGPIIPDLETLIFCLQHKDNVYHETTILPSCQYFTWSLNRLRLKLREGKLYFAERR
jgi:hypothetical protein